MSEKEENNDEGAIHRVDTVPPPDGEGDAYNAPTRVGPMADSVLKEMMHALESKTAELSQRAVDRAKPTSPPAAPEKPPSQSTKAASPAQSTNAKPSPAPRSPEPPPAEKRTGAPSTPSKASQAPKPPLPPRPTPGAVAAAAPPPAAPSPGVKTAPPPAAVPPSAVTSAPSPTAPENSARAMPSFHDDSDDDADEYGATVLHPHAQPPPPMYPATSTTPPATAPSIPPNPVISVATRSRAPIPFDPAPRAQAPERLPLLPLAIGFGIFFIGVLLYLLVR